MQQLQSEGLVFCPSCKAQNPDDNRFCGKCGATLARKAAPGAGGGDVPKELIEFDKKIPLIAQPGIDRRNNVPPEIRDKAKETIERDRAREAQTQRFPVKPASEMETQRFSFPPPQPPKDDTQPMQATTPDPRSEKTIQMPSSFLGIDMTQSNEEQATIVRPAIETRKETARPASNGFLNLNAEPPKKSEPFLQTNSTKSPTPTKSSGGFLNLDYQPTPKGNVTGPSFLGLSDTEEVDEEEIPVEESHGRRNLALVILLVLVGLAATQWKAIRENTLPFVKNGTEYIKVRVRGKSAEPPPAETTSNTQQNASSNNGAPNMEVAPTNQNLPQQQAQNPQQPAADANPAATTPGATTPADTTAATKPSTANATPTPSEDSNDSAEMKTSDTEETTPAKPSKKSAAAAKKASKPSAQERPQISTEDSQAGQAELQQAMGISDPAAQAAAYWKAVKAGNPEASVRLAEMYINGKGVTRSCDQALVLLRSASAHSYARARGKLGAMYATGECVKQDRVEAYKWMTQALDANPNSLWTAQYRDSLWNQMTAAERMRAKR